MITILLTKKRFEVFPRQIQVSSEITHQGELFGLADIIENQYVDYTIDSSLFSTLEEEILNAVTFISTQTLHQ